MDLSLTPDQLELQRTALRFVDDLVRPAQATGDLRSPLGQHRDLWPAMAELGWTALAVPDAHGGLGAHAGDTAVLFEALGHGPLQAGLFETAVLAPALVAALGAVQFLAPIARGEVRFCVADPTRPVGELRARGSTITGRVPFVRDAADATHLLLLSTESRTATALALDQPGVDREHHRGFGQRLFTVTMRDAATEWSQALTPELADAAEVAMLRALPVLCAYQVGSMQAVVELTIAYANERRAFGKPIASYQRVQDHIISAVNHLDSARWATNYALALCDAEPCPRAAIHVAKALAADGHHDACTSAHEVHAGIGTDLTYPLAAHTMLARGLFAYLGDPRWHRRHLTPLLGLI